MRRALATSISLTLGSGCFLLDPIFSASEEHGKVEAPEAKPAYAHVPTAWDRWLYGTGSVGQWARYRVNESGVELACVGESPDGKWFEVREGKKVSAQLVSKEGRVLKAFYAEEPFEVAVTQEIVQTPDGTAAPGFEAVAMRKIGEEGGSPDEAHRWMVVERYEDDLGFTTTVTTVWNAMGPWLYAVGPADSLHGGLSWRESPKGSVHLDDRGSDARPRVKIPP